MNLDSPLFDRIRTKQAPRAERQATAMRCDAPGCAAAGDFRAPMGRTREGQYFCFCLEHVRAYNNSYNYFNGMSDADVARYLKDATVGHRPTWTAGAGRGAPGMATGAAEARERLGHGRGRFHPVRAQEPRAPRYPPLVMRALAALGLEDTATPEDIRGRYKELVKRHHPDANGGDRSREEKLREIIHAYKMLRTARLA